MSYRFARMTIGRLYHVIHIVDDLDAAQAFYGSVFPLETYTDHEWSDFDKRLASLSILTDNFVIEVIEPSRAEEHRDVSLPKFAHRFGCRLHSMAWFSDDVPALAERFRAAGIRVLDGGYGTIFTHPKDTFGQLQFQTGPPEVPVPDPRLVPGWAPSPATLEHPLGLVRASHVTTMASDLDAATKLYEGPLAGELVHEHADEDARHAYFLVGTDTIVDLAEPRRSGTALHEDLERNGQLPHSFTMLVRDLDEARRHLADVGVHVVDVDETTVLIDPAASFGARIALTDEPLPGDPR
jgi:catechol 2,3-dioxygenase-like lactoylglutathione lyase family enzyme